jgi:hypothetical protein
MLAVFAPSGAHSQTGSPDEIVRFRPADAQLTCAQLRQEALDLDKVVSAAKPPEPEAPGVGQRIVSNVAGNVGGVAGQIAGSAFGAFGSMFGRVAGAAAATTAAQSATATPAAPPVDPAVAARARLAQDRVDSLNRIAGMKACRASEPSFAGNPLTTEQVAMLATPGAAGAGPATSTFNPAVLQAPGPLINANLPIDGQISLEGRRVFISEFRVLFENAGSVTASTRGGYLFRTNYGSTSVKVSYAGNLDMTMLQAITDQAWRDFQARAAAEGITLESASQVASETGGAFVYEATEAPSQPGKLVEVPHSEGYGARNYIAVAPSGMKLHARGITGIGAGSFAGRMAFSQRSLEGLAISYTVNLASLESSGSGSSIFRRGSSADASAALSVGGLGMNPIVQTHLSGGLLRSAQRIEVPGQFAFFREASRYDTATDARMVALSQLSAQMGVAANQSSNVSMTVELDPNAYASLALQGLASLNQSVVTRLKQGL